ncbi:MAG: molybdopterin-dependent oxidoreductase [Actinomycetia bacterium]|nr:molybdopterin-dependent oxidoreductase [Actinomycetes bacterium]
MSRTHSRTHYGICNLCDSVCGLKIEVQGREILSIRGDEKDVFSHGHICPKGLALKDIFDDPDRLRHPVRKVGDQWREISWAEAFGEIRDRVADLQRRHGRDSVALYYGNPIGHGYQAMISVLPLIKLLGSRNIFSSNSVDAHPRMLVSLLLYGNQALLPIPDIERTDLLVVQGANPVVSHGSVMSAPDTRKRLKAIGKRGGRMVVIDPRRSETAAIADEHHFIQPGTDALLLLAVLHTLSAEGALRQGPFTRLRGQQELLAAAAKFSPERVARVVGIEAESIRKLALDFAAAPRAVWYGRMGTCTQEFGCLSTWLIDAINIVTGNFDREGGAMFTTPAVDLAGLARLLGEPGRHGRWRSRVSGLPEFNGETPVAGLADEIETPGDGQVRGLISVAGNPVLSNPNGRRLDRAFESLEFMASVDFFINETTRHSDLILPPTSALENDHYPILELAMGVRNVAHYSPALFAPETRPNAPKPDWEILLGAASAVAKGRGGLARLAGIALRGLGAGLRSGRILDLLLWMGPQQLRLKDLLRAPHGIDLGPLQPRAHAVVQTKDKQVDLAPTILMEDLSRLESRLAVPTGKDQLLLISRRTLKSMNSWLNNSPLLVKGRGRCTLLMHPEDAAQRGLEAGQQVTLRSRVGEIRVPLEPSDCMKRGVVSLPYGWGHDREGSRLSVASLHAGASMNDVTDETLVDAVSGTSVLDGIPVEVGTAALPQPSLAR